MGLYGPPKSASQRLNKTAAAKTGGAGNMPWYNDTIRSVASSSSPSGTRRVASATRSGGLQATGMGIAGGAQAAMQFRPATATVRSLNAAPSPAIGQAYPSASNIAIPLSTVRPQTFVPMAATGAVPMAEEHQDDCICSVCNCGKHACPPTPRTNHYDPNLTTEARSSYNGRFEPAVRAKAPGEWKPRNVPFEGRSTHQEDFKNHGVLPRQNRLNRSAMMDTGVGRSHVPFDGTTTFKSEFPAHPLQPRESAAPKVTLNLERDNRDFVTEGRQQYVPHPVQPKRNRPVEAARPSLPFSGESTHKSTYKHHADARPSIPNFRSSAFVAHPEDREFLTENRTHFTPKKNASCPAVAVAVPAKPHSGHVKVEKEPMTGTYRRKDW